MPAAEPVCECHRVPMRWHPDKRVRRGGRWRCRVAANEHDRRRRLVLRSDPERVARERQRCRDFYAAKSVSDPGWFAARAASDSRRYEESRDTILARARARYDADPVYRIELLMKRGRQARRATLDRMRQRLADETPPGRG